MGCRFLLQGIFPTQGSNPGLPYCRQILYLYCSTILPQETRKTSNRQPNFTAKTTAKRITKNSKVSRRKRQPIPVFLPGKFHGQRSLVGYSPWGLKESDTTELLHFLPLRTAFAASHRFWVVVFSLSFVYRNFSVTHWLFKVVLFNLHVCISYSFF